MLNKVKRFTLLSLLVAGTTLAYYRLWFYITTKHTNCTMQSRNWSETFDGTKTDFAVNATTYSCRIHVPSNNGNDAYNLGLEDKMAGTAFQRGRNLPTFTRRAYDKVKVLSDKWPSYEVFM